MSIATSKSKPKLAHSVRQRILSLLKEERYAPGQPLPSERELMEMFGVGRPAVREAMQSLEAVGLVEIRHGGRAKVTSSSIASLVEQFSDSMRHVLANSTASLENLKEARFAFEKSMAHQAAIRRTKSDLMRMEQVLAAQRQARSDTATFLTHDKEFHRTIAMTSGNPIYGALSEALFEWLSDFHIDVVLLPGRELLTLDEHTEILKAIADRAPEQAAKAMHDHLTRANKLYHRTHLAPTGSRDGDPS